MTDALSTSPAAPTGPGLYYLDPAFVLDADGLLLCASAATPGCAGSLRP